MLLANALLAVAGAKAAKPPMDPTLALAQNSTTMTEPGSIAGLTPEALALQLIEYHNGNYANIARTWDVMERRDDAAMVAARKLRSKVGRRINSFMIEAVDDSPEALRQRDFLEGFYNRLLAESAVNGKIRGGVKKAAEFMLRAVSVQYSFLAKSWVGRGPDISLKLRWTPLWFFGRRNGDFMFDRNGMGGAGTDPLMDEQWLTAATDFAVMEPASVLILFKRLPQHQLVSILNKWGNTSVYGEVPAGIAKGSDTWNMVMDCVANIRSGWHGVVGGGAKLNTLEPKQQTGALLHMPWIKECNSSITNCYLGASLSTIAKGDTGTLAGGAQADDMSDLVDDATDWVVELFQEGVDRDALRYGLGVDEPMAWFNIRQPKIAADLNRFQVIKGTVEMGAKVKLSQVYDEFDLQQAGPDDEVLTAPAPAPAINPFAGNAGGAVLVPPATPGEGLRPVHGGDADQSRSTATAAAPVTAPAVCCCAAPARYLACAKKRSYDRAIRDLDQLFENTVDPVGRAYAAMLQPLFQAVAAAPDLAAAKNILDGFKADTGNMGKVLGEAAFAAVLRGLEPIRPEIKGFPPKAVGSAGVPTGAGFFSRLGKALRTRFANAPVAALEYAPLPFEEAKKFWSMKTLIKDLATIAEPTWKQAVTYGFKVAGISADSALNMIKDDLESAIKGEVTVQQFVKDAQVKYGLNSAHAETVARTNIQTAYSWGHYQQLTDPAVAAVYNVWGFDVVDDPRTSDICRPLIGKAYLTSNKIWDSLYPPNHFNCRTTIFPMALDEVEKMGFTLQDAWPRDPQSGAEFMPAHGFEMNIGKVPTLEQAA